ncbi:MAG: alpha/beta hydrolase [Myxococcales bacterium]|nr:alpha/beta hydrolase [Myxococcales bacterium]
MVLCDGLGCDGFAWKYLDPYLSERHRVLRWHYRGHGSSSMPEDDRRIGMDYTCADLEQLMEAVGLPSAILFGHSMGVQVALEFHRRCPSRVAGLVLVCGSYGNPLDTFHDHTLLRRAFPAVRDAIENRRVLARKVTSLLMKTELVVQFALRTELNRFLLDRGDIAPYFDHLARMDPVAFVRTLDSLKDHTTWDHLPHVRVPTLVFGGETDRFTPAWLSRRMAETIPGGEFTLIPGGSHTAPLEQPGLVQRRVERFLRTHFGVRPGPPPPGVVPPSG